MKILFLHQESMSFVQRDRELLRRNFDVEEMKTSGSFRDLPRLAKKIRQSDVIFCWFGKLHAFWAVLFAKLFGKKTIVVAGGDDVANVGELGYGLFSHPLKRHFGLFLFGHCDLVLAVSEYNRQETFCNAKVRPEKVKLLYHGFEEQIFCSPPGVEKEPLAITVGRITMETIAKKGLKLFVESARFTPGVRFIVIGPAQKCALDVLKRSASQNVEFPGPLYGSRLVRALSAAKVYAQPSVHESFGCSVAEAMLCECVPVVSRLGALPEVVGDSGLFVDTLRPEALAATVLAAMEAPEEVGKAARQRIVRRFPVAAREAGLIEAIEMVSRI